MRFRSSTTVISTLALLLITAVAAHAGLTTEGCFAAKRKAAGNMQKCRAGEEAKILQGKPGDVPKCASKLALALAKLDVKASVAAIACRFRDNGDGTVTDFDSGLVWEKKTNLDTIANPGDPHDADNVFTWSASGSAPDGTSFSTFLAALNANLSTDGGVGTPITGCFTDHCDWRLPTIVELQGITDLSLCGNPNVCIDPLFVTPAYSFYWTATTSPSAPTTAWDVKIGSNFLLATWPKINTNSVRAVRGGW